LNSWLDVERESCKCGNKLDDKHCRGGLKKMAVADQDRASLCELLDRVLNTGVVVFGEVLISVAGVDLIYLNLQLLLTSVETARKGNVLFNNTTSLGPETEKS